MKLIIYLLIISLILTGCESEKELPNFKPKGVKSLDLMDADYLAIKDYNKKTYLSENWTNLYKITKAENELV